MKSNNHVAYTVLEFPSLKEYYAYLDMKRRNVKFADGLIKKKYKVAAT